jgi:phosphoglycolate phosphatase
MKFRAILFDLDGTLLDTLDDIAYSMNAALRELGAPPLPAAAYRRHVGSGLDKLAYRVLPEGRRDDATIAACVAAMRAVYATRWAHATKPYDGILEMLSALRTSGVRCAVLSNKAHDFTVKIAVHFFGGHAFDLVLGGGKFAHKPDPAGALYIAKAMGIPPAGFLYAGDSDVDMQTAVSAGMYPVAVTWGFRTREELLANGAKALASRPAEILLLAGINPRS